jgi:DivIVA domain-containing protein
MTLTADDVRNAMFRQPRPFRRGYNKDQVDEFLDLVVDRLEGRGDLTAEDVRQVGFGRPPWGKRGYHEDDVDALLYDIAATLDRLPRRR